MSDDIKDTLYNIYECFLLRDLVFIFGGSLILGSIYYVFNGDIITAVNYVTQNFFKFLLFLIVSYFTGIIVSDGVKQIKFIKIVEPDTLMSENFNFTILMARIREKWGVNTIRRIERCIYFKKVGSVIGSALLISALILVVSIIINFKLKESIMIFVLLIFSMVCLIENRQITDGLKLDLEIFAERLKQLGEKVD